MTDATIPLLDLTPQTEALWDQYLAALQAVIRGGRFILGPNVQAFEQEVAAYLGVKHAIGVNSGTDALVLGLRAAGVGPGEEVLTTPFSFFATAESISILGARPVFVDIEADTFNLDVSQVEVALTARTRAVVPVHLFGQAVDMAALLQLARRYGLRVVEDVAQAFGGQFRGRKLGTWGEAGCFSFFPSKPLGGMGDGGMVTTDDDGIAETVRMLRAHGARRKYHNEVIGYNSRLDELQAAILRVKLPHVDEWTEGRRAAAAHYHELLGEVPGVVTPAECDYGTHVWHQYTVRILDGRRDAVQRALADAGIETMIYYPLAIHQLPAYAGQYPPLPVAEQAAQEVLSLPLWPEMSPMVASQVAEVLINCLA